MTMIKSSMMTLMMMMLMMSSDEYGEDCDVNDTAVLDECEDEHDGYTQEGMTVIISSCSSC